MLIYCYSSVFRLMSFFPQHANNLTPCGYSIPEQVKKNALAEVFNILVSNQKEVEAELLHTLDKDDPTFAKLRELVSAGEIPSME